MPRFLPPAVLIVASLLACERSRPAAPPDTSRPAMPESVQAVQPPPPAPAWDSAAGPVLFVRSGSPDAAFVVFPEYADSTLPDTVRFDVGGVRGVQVDLFGRGGLVGTARVADVRSTQWSGDECVEWPKAVVRPTADSGAVSGWTVAFLHGRAESVPLDSIESMPRPDSARLAADVTRLVSALPDDTSRTFRGIPFSVQSAYRFPVGSGVDAVVADVVRRLNQEANPLEQHTLLVAERATSAQAGYHVVFHERAAGSEETLETTDVLAAVRFPASGRIALVLLREGLETSAYALLVREPQGTWHVRWTSVHTGC